MTNKTLGNNFWKISRPFRILTGVSVLDINSDFEKVEKLTMDQNLILSNLGIDTSLKAYSVNFGNRCRHNETIPDAIQCLALKDGADLVQFENGNYGYVGYYAGISENWFEILGDMESEDE